MICCWSQAGGMGRNPLTEMALMPHCKPLHTLLHRSLQAWRHSGSAFPESVVPWGWAPVGKQLGKRLEECVRQGTEMSSGCMVSGTSGKSLGWKWGVVETSSTLLGHLLTRCPLQSSEIFLKLPLCFVFSSGLVFLQTSTFAFLPFYFSGV